MMLIGPMQKEETVLAVDTKTKELKTYISNEVDQKLMALETWLVQQINENRLEISIRLQEINDLVTTV